MRGGRAELRLMKISAGVSHSLPIRFATVWTSAFIENNDLGESIGAAPCLLLHLSPSTTCLAAGLTFMRINLGTIKEIMGVGRSLRLPGTQATKLPS